MNRILIALLLIITSLKAEAQIHEFGVFAGGANYIGDVGPTNYIAPNDLALGLMYRWNRSPRHSWRASFTYGHLSSDDADSDSSGRKQRGYSFENSVKELSAGLEFNFFDFNLHESDIKFTPYVYTGLSYFWYTDLYIQNGDTKEGDNKSGLAIPMTVGIKTNILENFVLGFEVGARYTFTDNLDGSNPDDDKYQDLRFGNLDSNDWYVFTGFTLTYTFGNKPCYCSE
jgi:long-subunit fatty acid transport protein